MILLGIDPGATTGWCRYDADAKKVLACGEFPIYLVPPELCCPVDAVVIESFAAVHAGIYPQTVQAAYTCGRIVERVGRWATVHELTRHDTKKALHTAIHGEFPIKKDRDVWSALQLLHGGPLSIKKGGPLHGCKSHARAALAVVVAWNLLANVRAAQVASAAP